MTRETTEDERNEREEERAGGKEEMIGATWLYKKVKMKPIGIHN